MSGPGYTPVDLDDGTVLQSAVHNSGDPDDWHDSVSGYITRAVITKVYYPDDSSWGDKGWAAGKIIKPLCCDVRTYGRSGTRPLYRVPFCQLVAGLFDEDTYVPRDARQHIEGGTLTTGSDPNGTRPTPAELMDGDHVLVGFLENDPFQPVILPFCLSHPGMRNPPQQADGRRRRIRFNGALIELDKNGNIVLDAAEAAKDELGARGTETPNLGDGGNVTIKTKTSGGSDVQIKLDAATGKVELSDTPTDGVLKGDTFKEALYIVLTAIASAITPTPPTAAVDAFKQTESTWLSTKVFTG